MDLIKWQCLQLFADGGATGGDAGAGEAESGSNAADAGRQFLKDAGVPEGFIKGQFVLPADRQPKRKATEPQEDSQIVPGETPKQEAAPTRKSWEEIKKEYAKEYGEDTAKAVNGRLKSAKAAEANLDALRPALEVLTRQYGLDLKTLDYGELASKVNGDPYFYRALSAENGLPDEVNMQLDQQQRELNRTAELQRIFHERMEQQQQEAQFDAHIADLRRQGEALKQVYPSFDFDTAFQDPQFRMLTQPGGVSVERAYIAMHATELMQSVAGEAVEKGRLAAANAVRSGASRPRENGISAQASSSPMIDVRKMNASQINALMADMAARTARGEEVDLTTMLR